MNKAVNLLQLAQCAKYYANKELDAYNNNEWENIRTSWEPVEITPETRPDRIPTNGPWMTKYGPNFQDIQEEYIDEISVLMKYFQEIDDGMVWPVNDKLVNYVNSLNK